MNDKMQANWACRFQAGLLVKVGHLKRSSPVADAILQLSVATLSRTNADSLGALSSLDSDPCCHAIRNALGPEPGWPGWLGCLSSFSPSEALDEVC